MSDHSLSSPRTASTAPSSLVVYASAFLAYLTEDFLGGPKRLKMAWVTPNPAKKRNPAGSRKAV